jgi:flagellar basal-body rod protein FlgB
MASPIFNDWGLRALYLGLDGLAMRQRATANNIANVDTPNYKAQRVEFEAQLQRAIEGDLRSNALPMTTTDAQHIRGVSQSSMAPLVTVDSEPNAYRNDNNNVDIDLEMVNLAETQIRFQAVSQMTSQKLIRLKTLIQDSA